MAAVIFKLRLRLTNFYCDAEVKYFAQLRMREKETNKGETNNNNDSKTVERKTGK